MNNLNSEWFNWTNEKVELLKTHFPSMERKKLCKLLECKFHIARTKARKLGVKRDRGVQHRKSNIKILLEDTPISYYWLGFLLADGHFANNRALVLTMSIEDIDHFLKFKNFISKKEHQIIENNHGYKNANKVCQLIASDYINIKKLCDKFEIYSNKTKYPPNLSYITEVNNDLFLSLFIGFIDGDGCIVEKDKSISIEVYHTWKNLFTYIESRIYQIFNIPLKKSHIYFYKENCVRLNFYRQIITYGLKQKALELNLPIMSRKWSKI